MKINNIVKNLRKRKLERVAKSLILPWERVTLPDLEELSKYPHGIQAIYNAPSIMDTNEWFNVIVIFSSKSSATL